LVVFIEFREVYSGLRRDKEGFEAGYFQDGEDVAVAENEEVDFIAEFGEGGRGRRRACWGCR
jgi:hypothetical protein